MVIAVSIIIITTNTVFIINTIIIINNNTIIVVAIAGSMEIFTKHFNKDSCSPLHLIFHRLPTTKEVLE